jgi:hypothetical protein
MMGTRGDHQFSVMPLSLALLHAHVISATVLQWLRHNVFVMLRDFAQCQQVAPRQWLSVFVEALSFPNLVFVAEAVFQRIATEMGRGTPERIDFFTALCVRLGRASAALARPFATYVLLPAKDDARGVLMQWILPIIQACGSVPDVFLAGMV